MAVTKVLARDWTVQVKSGGNYLAIRGINSFTVAPSKTDADTSDFGSGGFNEHVPAARGNTITLEGFHMESDGAATAATLTTHLLGTNNDLTYTCANTGTGGNAITLAYVDPGIPDQTLSVNVTGNAVTVNLATNGASAITSTAALIKAAVEAAADPTAGELLITYPSGSNGSGVVTAMAITNLAGGDTDGGRDPGQARCEVLAGGVGPDYIGYFRMYTPGGTRWDYAGTVQVDGPGGSTNDAASWKATVVVTGQISIT